MKAVRISTLASLILVPVLLWASSTLFGCTEGSKETRVSVPADLQGLVEQVLKTGDESNEAHEITIAALPSPPEATLAELLDKADVVVTNWSRRIIVSHEAGDLSVLSIEQIASEGVWPASLMDFLRAESGLGQVGLPLTVDPWIMMWNREYLAATGPPPGLWEDLADGSGPVFGLAGSAKDARLGWASLLADAYPAAETAAPLAAWREGLRRLDRMQDQGSFQRAAFSYPWSDALAILRRGEVGAVFAPMSVFRSLEAGDQAALEVRRPPDALGRSDYPLIANFLLAVVKSGSLEKPGVHEVLATFADSGVQRALADRRGSVPARIDAPVRDGAAFAAVAIARTAGYFLPLPSATLSAEAAAELAELSLTLLRSPAPANDIFAEYGL